jgi:hypothetical protein
MKKVAQECFDQNLLLIYDNNENTIPTDKMRVLNTDLNKYKYFLPHKNNSFFYVRVQLPPDVTCKYCVLQWRYRGGNNYGKADNDDVVCLGCSAKQEEFYNCADISIFPDKNKKYVIDDSSNLNSTSKPIVSSSFRPDSSLIHLLFLPLLVYIF